jgi:hypothetical protein
MFHESYKRIQIEYLEDQRKNSKDAFQRSFTYCIKKTEQNKMFNMLQ